MKERLRKQIGKERRRIMIKSGAMIVEKYFEKGAVRPERRVEEITQETHWQISTTPETRRQVNKSTF